MKWVVRTLLLLLIILKVTIYLHNETYKCCMLLLIYIFKVEHINDIISERKMFHLRPINYICF